MTAPMATQVGSAMVSRKISHAISAASRGTPACISTTFATVVYCSATMKELDAEAKQSATAMPGTPMPRKSAIVPRSPSRQSRKASMKAAAQSERQNTMVQLSLASRKRASAPPNDQTTADRKTRK
jgi:hypothetical protein